MRTLSGSEMDMVVGGQNPAPKPILDPFPPGNNNPVTTQDDRMPGADEPDWTVTMGQDTFGQPANDPPPGDSGGGQTVTGVTVTNTDTNASVTVGVTGPVSDPTGVGAVVRIPF